MQTIAQKEKPAQQRATLKIVRSGTVIRVANRRTEPSLHLQRALGNEAVQRLLRENSEGFEENSGTTAVDGFGCDLSRIPVHDHASTNALTKPSLPLSMNQGNSLHILRARVSRVTGTDVGGVPVEIGDARGKRAVTHEGRVTLGSKATEHDIAHELAHAAQQRASSGALLGVGEAERRADQVASAALSNQGASVAVGRVPSAAVLAAGDPYVREVPTLPPPPPGVTVKDLKDQIQEKIKSGDITSYTIPDVKSGDPEEKFLYNALFRLAKKELWGSELDLVTSIGAGKGEVTVRIDAKGVAEVRLVGKSVPKVQAAFTTPREARDALAAKYKLAGVTGERGKSWSLDELNKVWAAWGRLAPAEASALEGYSLIRTDRLSLHGELLQGQTTHTDELEQEATRAKHLREIRFADSAFAGDDKSFIGDVKDAAPASFEILIHEVGHAVEGKPYDDLNALAAVDMAKTNQTAKDAHAAQLTTNRAINAALSRLSHRIPVADVKTGQLLFTAVQDAQNILKGLEQSPDAAKEAAAKKAIDDRDAVKAKIAESNKVLAGLARSLTEQDAYFAALKKLREATDTSTASRAKADALKAGPNTKRLQAFIDYVNKWSIPRPTAYAEKHWPGEPAEFFDEAFSLWKNDPVFFAKYSPKLKEWFDAGNHLK